MDTASWDPEQVGVYTRLLFYQWVNGSIPNDLDKIARIAGYHSGRKWQSNLARMWRELCHKFATLPDGNLVNLRLEETRKKQDEFRNKLSESGQLGIEKKKEMGIFPFKPPLKPGFKPPSKPKSSSSVFSLQSSINKDLKPVSLPVDNSRREIETELKNLTEYLYQSKIFSNAPGFKNACLKQNKNPKAIIHALTQIKNNRPKDPWGYGVDILKVEDGNYNEKEFQSKSSQYKADFLGIAENLKKIKREK